MLPSLLCLDPQRKLCLEERRFGHSAGRLGNRPRRGAAGSLIASGTILQVDTGVSRPKVRGLRSNSKPLASTL